ncbi:MAG: sugar kinase [Treponema sp.]|nr:sugar kinase [Treponema sp.]
MGQAKVVTFGEVMLRIASLDFLKWRQSLPGKVDVTFAGAEANVAASLSLFECPTKFVTAIPKHSIADACVGTLRNVGIDTSDIVRTDDGRIGIYFVETGANQRPSTVIYDRAGATVALANPEMYDWKKIFQGAQWFHFTGITPALSRLAADATLAAAKTAHEMGLTISCDLNFRKKLWDWESGVSAKALAGKVMNEILPFVDVLVGNEEDAEDVLGIKAGDTDVTKGKLDIERYPFVARDIVKKYPNIKKVATTLRESISASHNNWGAMLYNAATDKCHFAPDVQGVYTPYEIRNIVDRIGGGDSFTAGLIYSALEGKSDEESLAFAVASSCLCHSVYGDFNFTTKDEVLTLMKGDASGRVKR